MELIKLTDKTYYIKNRTNIGVIQVNDQDVYLVDTGNDSDAGKKILKIVEANNWHVIGIINTHSHADHIGGNKIIIERTNAPVMSSSEELAFIKYPILEPSMLYGAYPFKDLQNKFLMADTKDFITSKQFPMEIISLKGHSPAMIGIKTPDEVVFIGDALFPKEIIEKYHIFYLYDIESFLNTLDYLENLSGRIFVPAHGPVLDNLGDLITLNRQSVHQIIDAILTFLKEDLPFEELQSKIFNYFKVDLNINQYVLLGSTIKAYLSYLVDKKRINYYFQNGFIYYTIVS